MNAPVDDRSSQHDAIPAGPDGGAPVRLRRIEERDLPELVRLDVALFPELAYPLFALRQLIDVHGERLKVIEDRLGLCGYVLVATRHGADRSWILGLGVAARCRRLGYGRRLMAEALAMSADDGVREVRLTVDPTNPAARQLYESFGFVPDTYRVHYFGPGADRLVMTRSLARPAAAPPQSD